MLDYLLYRQISSISCIFSFNILYISRYLSQKLSVIFAYKTVNVLLVERNWLLGKRIAEEELKDNRKDNYGKEIINELSKRLTKDFGRGFEKANIYRFVQFYKTYPDFFSSAMRQSILSWTHYRILLR